MFSSKEEPIHRQTDGRTDGRMGKTRDAAYDSHIIRRNTVKGKVNCGVNFSTGNPSQSYGASSAIWDHTVLPATRHR